MKVRRGMLLCEDSFQKHGPGSIQGRFDLPLISVTSSSTLDACCRLLRLIEDKSGTNPFEKMKAGSIQLMKDKALSPNRPYVNLDLD